MQMKKCFAIILVMSLLSMALCANAWAEAAQPRDSDYFHSYGTTMGADGNGRLIITFDVLGMGICTQLGVASYSVDKLSSEGWVNVSGLLKGETGANVASYMFSRTFQGIPGDTYRVQVTFFCMMNGGAEHKHYTSTGVTVY